mmetsp:Transcript_26617/g.26862  ORF Transcript_26617/g.26862 Transcript_26617/m.26862 type:complete len:90 (-) Transcript_26617:49-318(-)
MAATTPRSKALTIAKTLRASLTPPISAESSISAEYSKLRTGVFCKIVNRNLIDSGFSMLGDSDSFRILGLTALDLNINVDEYCYKYDKV